jgi:hypothetical protein
VIPNDYRDFDDEVPARQAGGRPRLPGGVSLQTAAIILLGLVLVTILWLFFGPVGEESPPGLPTPTAVAAAVATGSVGPPPAAGLAATAGTTAAPPARAEAGTAVGAPAGTAVPPASGTLVSAAGAAGLSQGGFVSVGNTDGFGIRLRFGPGLDYATVRIVLDGETLRVAGGPESGDGEQWWRLQDNQGNIGWAAVQYLTPAAAPAGWNPPAASPTAPAGSGTVEPGGAAAPTP